MQTTPIPSIIFLFCIHISFLNVVVVFRNLSASCCKKCALSPKSSNLSPRFMIFCKFDFTLSVNVSTRFLVSTFLSWTSSGLSISISTRSLHLSPDGLLIPQDFSPFSGRGLGEGQSSAPCGMSIVNVLVKRALVVTNRLSSSVRSVRVSRETDSSSE